MSKSQTIDFECLRCGNSQETVVFTSVTASLNIELKQKLLSNQLNKFHCTNCRAVYNLEVPILYHDVTRKFAVWYSTDRTYTPEILPFNNYLSGAKVVHTLEALRALVSSMAEDELITDPFSIGMRRLVCLSPNFTINDSLRDFKKRNRDHLTCSHCGGPDAMFGLSHNCENCGVRKIKVNGENLYVAMGLLKILNHYLNQFPNKGFGEEIEKRISQFSREGCKRNSLNEFLDFCTKMKVCGTPTCFLDFTGNKWKLHLDQENGLGQNPEEVIIANSVCSSFFNLIRS